MANNYEELEKSSKVESVEFVGGGVALVKLAPGWHNKGVVTRHAATFQYAKAFVDGATSV
jgi:hypothetical protein